MPKNRATLLILFAAMAMFDTCGKVIEHDAGSLAFVNRTAASLGLRVRARGAHGANFDIFRASTRHLVAGEDPYARYPDLHDRFKYSPTFALLFAPLSYLPWGLALLLWQLINCLALFYALVRVVPDRDANVALGIVTLEVWRSMQNSQSNGLVAALMILSFVALERRRDLSAGLCIALGALIKIFPLAAGLLILPDRRRARAAAWAAAFIAMAAALPLLVVGPRILAAQYASWLTVETIDARARMLSVMGLLHHIAWLPALPNPVVQLAGLALLALPLVRRADWLGDALLRQRMLASVLMFSVLFNHQAERASYVIAFAGIAIWYVNSERRWLDVALLGVALVSVSVVSMLVPGRAVRSPELLTVRLVCPVLAIWARLQFEMLRERAPGTMVPARVASRRA